jgi:hypothetical protein
MTSDELKVSDAQRSMINKLDEDVVEHCNKGMYTEAIAGVKNRMELFTKEKCDTPGNLLRCATDLY